MASFRAGLLIAILFAAAAAVGAQEPPAAVLEALALVSQDDLPAAIAKLEELQAGGEAPPQALGMLGALYLETGRPALALEILAPLAEAADAEPAVLYNAGRAAAAQGADVLHEQFDRGVGHLGDGLADGGDGRFDGDGEQRVVETDHRKVVGHLDAAVVGRRDGAGRHVVVGRDDGRGGTDVGYTAPGSGPTRRRSDGEGRGPGRAALCHEGGKNEGDSLGIVVFGSARCGGACSLWCA